MNPTSWKDFIDEDPEEDNGGGFDELPSLESLALDNEKLGGLLSERDALQAQLEGITGSNPFETQSNDPRYAVGEIPSMAEKKKREQEREEQRQRGIEAFIRSRTEEQEWQRNRDENRPKGSTGPSDSEMLDIRRANREDQRFGGFGEKLEDFNEKRDKIQAGLKNAKKIKDRFDDASRTVKKTKDKFTSARDKFDKFKDAEGTGELPFKSDQKIDNPLGKLDKPKDKFDKFNDRTIDKAPEKELKEDWQTIRERKREKLSVKEKFEKKAKKTLEVVTGTIRDFEEAQEKLQSLIKNKKAQAKADEAKEKAKQFVLDKKKQAREELEKRRRRRKRRGVGRLVQKAAEKKAAEKAQEAFDQKKKEAQEEERRKEREDQRKEERREEKRQEIKAENKREQRREARRRRKNDRFS